MTAERDPGEGWVNWRPTRSQSLGELGDLVDELDGTKRRLRELSSPSGERTAQVVKTLTDQVEALAALTTSAASGGGFNSGSVPGDSNWRWFDPPTGPVRVTLRPKTGKVLLTFGNGQATLGPGAGGNVTAAVSVEGGPLALNGIYSRLYFNQGIGAPLQASTVVTGLNPNADVTFTARLGVWCSGAAGSAQFAGTYLTAQVIQ